MPTVTSAGIVATTLAEYIATLEDIFKAVYGDVLNLSPESQQSQVIANIALLLAQADEAVIRAANASDINKAVGAQLEGLTSTLAVNRILAERTQVTVTLAGVAATYIPANARARSVNGDIFYLGEATQLGAGGTATATMYSAEAGNFPVEAGELIYIVDVVPGWETVTNAAASTPGRATQTDAQLRQDYFKRLARNASAVLDTITAAVYNVEGVTDVFTVENDRGTAETIEGVSIGAHTIALVAEGGGDTEIAAAIRTKKTIGAATQGTTEVNDRSPSAPIRFYRPTYINPEIAITISIRAGFPGNGQDLIKQRIQEYINGSFSPGNDGYFEVDGLRIAEDLYKHRLYTPINSVPGHDVTALTLDITGGASDVDVITANLNQKVRLASLSDITITVA